MASEYEDDDEPSSQVGGGGPNDIIYTESSAQAIAAGWAEEVIKKNPQVKQVDRPYVLAVLTEAAFFERPIKELACGINVDDDMIVITLKGYRNLMNDKAWYSVFLSSQRSDELKRVSDTFTQMTDNGLIKVIHVTRVVLQNSVRKNTATMSHSYRKTRK